MLSNAFFVLSGRHSSSSSRQATLGRTCGQNCSTAPEAFELTLEDDTDANEEPEDASLEAVLGRGRRVKKPTKRFTDAEWCGH